MSPHTHCSDFIFVHFDGNNSYQGFVKQHHPSATKVPPSLTHTLHDVEVDDFTCGFTCNFTCENSLLVTHVKT